MDTVLEGTTRFLYANKAAHITALAVREKYQHSKLLAHSCVSHRRAAQERACVFKGAAGEHLREGASAAPGRSLHARNRGRARAPLRSLRARHNANAASAHNAG